MRSTTEIITKAAVSSLERKIVRRLMIEPGLDSEGEDALDVTIVLRDANLSGAEVGQILLAIQTELAREGDERFPIVTFTTEDELALDGGPEP